MSTFKRLLNLGKGKVKAATRSTESTPTPSPGGDDWVADARHRAADAAETIAEAIRPESEEGAPARSPAPAPTVAEDASTPDEPEPPPTPATPRKRTL